MPYDSDPDGVYPTPGSHGAVHAKVESTQEHVEESVPENLVGVGLSGEEAVAPQEKSEDATTSTPKPRVTDKRIRVDVVPNQKDVFQSMLDKTFAFITEQPEFYTILQYPRPIRKQFGEEVAKLITRFPHFKKVGFREPS